jgi:hypothetical protein
MCPCEPPCGVLGQVVRVISRRPVVITVQSKIIAEEPTFAHRRRRGRLHPEREDDDRSDGPRLIPLWGRTLELAPTIRTEIWRDHRAHMMGQVDENRLDARKNLTKVKLAGGLTLLNDPHRVTIEHEEWDLAQTMWEISCNVRDHFRAQALAADKKNREASDTASAIRAGKQEIAKMEARDGYVPKAVIRCAKLIARHVNDGTAGTVSDCRQKLASRDRHLAEEAIEYAESVLWVKVDGTSVAPGEAEPK